MKIGFVVVAFGLMMVSGVRADEVDFAHSVVPILKKHCAECHTGAKSEGGFSFNTKRKLDELGSVVPGSPDKSRLIELVRSTDTEDQMPPADRPRLTDAEVQQLQKWVQAGVPWEPGFQFAEAAWEPPLKPRQVALPPALWPNEHPVDRILRAYFAAQHVSGPSAQPDASPGPIETVDDETFLRRAYMDLIGLLPTAEERLDFLNDARLDRRTQLIRRLLSRDRDYAEHWITFWNDLLRNDYAGTGYIDGGRSQITSWLYQALVENRPYDRMVRELIAPTPASEGFIRGIKWRGNVNSSQATEIQFAQSVSQVFLGINMKCASCHDSFIDRWTLDEAYNLAAVYSTRELEIHRCDQGTGRMATAAWIFPELGTIDASAEQPERLRQLAGLMTTPENGRFARTIVNRIWHRLMGRGIVHPVDAMHTPPWNADLLDFLANDFVAHNYDLKHLMLQIAGSSAYQMVSTPAQDSSTTSEFTFSGPIARHLTAEQLIDAVWQIGDTAPSSIQAPVPGALYYGDLLPDISPVGRWIWATSDVRAAAAGETVEFRRDIELAERPAKAFLVITCDNEYTAAVNGKQVAADGDWTTVESIEISKQLKAGRNRIEITGKNGGQSPNAAGLWAEVVITDNQGEHVRIGTDETWEFKLKTDPRQPEPKTSTAASAESGESTVNSGDARAQKETHPWAASAVIHSPQIWVACETSVSQELALSMGLARRRSRASLLKSNLLMRSLGRPNREQIVTTRPESLSTLQAIDLANGEILNDMLIRNSQRLLPQATDPASFIANLWHSTLSRDPSAQEMQICQEILGSPATQESVQDLLWSIIMLPEFQFVQ
ncbi:MAG: DUF1549 domain-containing protein [Planctomycetaceae bacterium]|nr:DUF1549 domain-containing protein [Planctomycetaceae bacterium]